MGCVAQHARAGASGACWLSQLKWLVKIMLTKSPIALASRDANNQEALGGLQWLKYHVLFGLWETCSVTKDRMKFVFKSFMGLWVIASWL